METGDGSQATSNIPSCPQAFLAPKLSPTSKENVISSANAISDNSVRNRWGGADVCARCGKPVYMAEKMMGGGSVSLCTLLRVRLTQDTFLTRSSHERSRIHLLLICLQAWHKITCFSCKECNKRLESTTLCERDGEIYCKSK